MPFTWMPFDGGSEAVTAVLGGHVDVVNTNPGNVLQHVEAGQLRVLGVMNDKRIDVLPDVPTYKEAGYDVDTSWAQWRGIFAKKGIPQEVIDKLSDAFLKAIKEPEFQKYLKDTNQMDGSLGPAEFTAAVKKTDEILKEILAESE
jgi:tripartite-type tricarboxylate transporter receptor subunit TctC